MDEELKELLGLVEHHLAIISYALTILVLEKADGQNTDWFNELMHKLAEPSGATFKERAPSEEEKEKS